MVAHAPGGRTVSPRRSQASVRRAADEELSLDGVEAAAQRVPAILRAAALLEILEAAEGEPVTLSELARRLELPKSSVANLAAALVATGFVRREGPGFALGRRLVELGGAYLSTVDQVQEFLMAAHRLPAASAETIQMSTLVGLEVVYLARHDGIQQLRLGTDVGHRFPANCTATGKAMLALLEPAELRRLLGDGPLPARTPRSITSVERLLAELERARRLGWAIDDEETTEGVVCLAVALPRRPEEEKYALSVTILKSRLDDAYREALIADLRQLASDLARPLEQVSRARQRNVVAFDPVAGRPA